MPVTICAAIRVGSAGASPSIPTDRIVNSADPSAIRMFVRKPALFRRSSRSVPSSAPSAAASNNRSRMSWAGREAGSIGVSWHYACTACESANGKREDRMLWTIVVLLLILWVLGFALNVAGGLIHILLVVALVVIVLRLLTGRRV